MPVTAKLSGKFYERFGDEIANELVDWFNAVDTTYQSQLKELNDLNWARVEARFGAVDARLDSMETVFDSKLAAFEARIGGSLDSRITRLRSDLILWMFGFWSATVIPLIALMLGLFGSGRD